ncbi:MAG: ergothioneine biosynthesis protein EgtB [Pseudomonadota bacterium]|nr:ergothioneine biosynthesis protein EgtB [Pseudomonadota bacterium]
MQDATVRSAGAIDGGLLRQYARVRGQTAALCAPLETEDYGLQGMADTSPPKWHLAHTTWFFETFLLVPELPGYRPFHPSYAHLFNSYYNGVGTQHPRPERGLLSRPTVGEVYAYRAAVDAAMEPLLERAETDADLAFVVGLGLNHEQQHQELLLTDLKYSFSRNPLFPVYGGDGTDLSAVRSRMAWREVEGGMRWIGASSAGFSFDNERPRHRHWLEPFRIADRLVTNGEYEEFIADGGYTRADLWLSDGWTEVRRSGWGAPAYWHQIDGSWHHYTLGGLRPVDAGLPVTHVSYYEAEAFARWRGKRLPSEQEWEAAAGEARGSSTWLESGAYHPRAAAGRDQLLGDCWEWTCSAYLPYPGYRPFNAELGEYNGKFMCNQMVLRGGSCASPAGHVRTAYRNFFYPRDRWQFTGIRLAQDG